MSITCDCNEKMITSKDGVTLFIPEGAIKEGDSVTFSIATGFCGPFIIPTNRRTDVISPYYWIGVTEYHFHKPVQVVFEHFGACDPSHYQLLCCEDDDKSYSMRPVDCELNFFVQGLCGFYTTDFCSYCLFHHADDPVINKIGAFLLKPENYRFLNQFTVEIWFSFTNSYCLRRNEELYTKKGMMLDTNFGHSFEAVSDKDASSYFALNYVQSGDGWCIGHSRSMEIRTKEVNFYNFYNDVEELLAHEKYALFPPRFILNVVKKSKCTTDLDTSITITLYKAEGEKLDTIFHKLFVPIFDAISPISKGNPKHHCSDKNPPMHALDKAGLNKVAEEVKKDLLEPSVHAMASLHLLPNPCELVRYLIDIPDKDFIYFITRLLPKEGAIKVITDIRYGDKTKQDKIEKICKAFLIEKDPSWLKVHCALSETGCKNLADIVEACFLPP